MWTLIGELQSLDRVLEALLAEYDVEEDRLRADLDDLIGELVKQGLLECDGESATS